ncbi:MAG: hypothetical protein JXA03_15560 [Bacteroidales bacterium]|nr:hypothetical protein [Bacteroidales bacterium]
MNFPVNINGQVYEWASITANIAGVPVAGITAITYKEEQAMEPVYGAGNRQVGYSTGKITNTGSLTLLMEEVEALQAASASGRLQDIPEFPVIVSYLTGDGKLANHTLKFCKFKNNGREPKEGDMSIAVTIDLLIGEIAWK